MSGDRPCHAELRPKAGLGVTKMDGLVGIHHFCFATYQRTDRLDWGGLRALHYYRLTPGHRRNPTFHSGFEIVTLVERGRLLRLGTFAPRETMQAGEIEVISPGMGASLGLEAVGSEPAHYYEIWVRSAAGSVRSGRQLGRPCGRDSVELLAAGIEAIPGTLSLHSHARISRERLDGSGLVRRLADTDCAYGLVLEGLVQAGTIQAQAGEGMAMSGPGRCSLMSAGSAEILLIETSGRQ